MPDALVSDTLIAAALGIGLAAACGFRVFVPAFVASVVARSEMLTLANEFQWMSSWAAIATFATATVLEIGAYYFPWLDNLLDTIATPLAVIAGILISAAFIHDMDPLLKWSLAVIAGGGVAGTIKVGLAGIRSGSSLTTGGTANPVVSTFEWISSVVMSVLAIFLPLLGFTVAIIVVAVFLWLGYRFAARWRKGAAGKDRSANSD